MSDASSARNVAPSTSATVVFSKVRDSVGQVIVTFKVMPADGDVDINNVEQEIKQKINPQKISHEPIAFGLVSLIVTKLVDEIEGAMETVEKNIRSINGVGEVEVVEINRSL